MTPPSVSLAPRPRPVSTANPGHTLESLPLDNGFARLSPAFHTPLSPAGLPDPHLIAVSAPVADLIGLDPGELTRPEFVEIFAGNRPLPGGQSLAAVYSGHQFGVWAGQLGDGRAHLLGGGRRYEPAGRSDPAWAQWEQWELQLKGAGKTPYSRGADGRAVLRSSLREFLCSEAMAGLGIPTTRALCLVGSSLPVLREGVESAAVVTRVAPSFVRFGSFEHWHARDRHQELRVLADYVIREFFPHLEGAEAPYLALLAEVSRRTGELLAQWMGVGFMHGVMNTDNMSILGLTLDYGPFGFMEAFDAGHICNHSDTYGRYAFRAQPRVAHWNLYCLADALLPLVGNPGTTQAAVDDAFVTAFEQGFQTLMGKKLGLRESLPDDERFIGETFGFLQQHRPDYTLFFRRLAALPAQAGPADRALLDLFVDRAAASAWLAGWRERLAQTPWADAPRQASMQAVNPKYVLRNWLAESAIREAQAGRFGELHRLLDCLREPYAEQPQYEAYAALPPDWATGLEVSCSS